MDKILLIVDPQVDFISGSLAVEGAKEKMDALASALQNGEIDCDYVMVTKDFHPSNHCSFKENGGQWPPHCVKGTTGSCIYAPLWSVICNYAYRKDTDIFIKGDSPDTSNCYLAMKYEMPMMGTHPHDEMAESDCWSQLCARHGEDVVNKVWSRHLASEFKRKKAPIYISRELYE